MDIVDLIYLHNPWFRDPAYLPGEARFPKRLLYKEIYNDTVSLKQIVSVTGLRRVGKSTLVKQIIANLLSQHEKRQTIFYFSFDQPAIEETTATLEHLLETYFNRILRTKPHAIRKAWIFLDEIQLIPYWQDIVKRYYDLNQNLKFVVTGSASLSIISRSRESLAGRIFERRLPPLTYAEYRMFTGDHDFLTYLAFGQFPELASLPTNERKKEYLQEGVIGKVLEVDIIKTYGIRKSADFERLFWALLPNAGQVIASGSLGSELGIKKATLFRYLSILENALLTQKIVNMSGSFRSSSRLLRKYYPASSNFLSLTAQPINVGFLVETYIASLLCATFSGVFLWRHRGKELDFLLPQKRVGIEVKYQGQLHGDDTSSLRALLDQGKIKNGVVITKNMTRDDHARRIRYVAADQCEDILLTL